MELSTDSRKPKHGQSKAANSYVKQNPPAPPPARQGAVERKFSGDKKKLLYNNKNKSSKSSQQQKHGGIRNPNLALNRFRFVLSPGSELCDKPLKELLSLPSSKLWNSSVALTCTDHEPICPICLDITRVGIALPCGHLFCSICIHRCLQAAESDPMLQKCPVCTDCELSKAMFRKCKLTEDTNLGFGLVQTIDVSNTPLSSNDIGSFACRIEIATGEGMMSLIEQQRKDFSICRKDLSRFRDLSGLKLLGELEAELDDEHIHWIRYLGKDTHFQKPKHVTSNYFYQRLDGSHEYIHPINLKCIMKSFEHDLTQLPTKITPIEVLEVEDWSVKGLQVRQRLKNNECYIPDFPVCCHLIEVNLTGIVSENALHFVEKECHARAKKREETQKRKLKMEIRTIQREVDIETERRRVRDEEEKMIRAFFGFEEKRIEEEKNRLLQNLEKPVALDSFSTVVSGMGHFPALVSKGTSPPTGPKQPIWNMPTSPPQGPKQWNMPTSPPQGKQQSSPKLTSSLLPPPNPSASTHLSSTTSFSQATTRGSGKKTLLWQTGGVW